MASEGISQEKAKAFMEALLLDNLLGEGEVAEAMGGPEPELSAEEKDMLDRIGSELPGKIRQWRAAGQGCIIPEHEERV